MAARKTPKAANKRAPKRNAVSRKPAAKKATPAKAARAKPAPKKAAAKKAAPRKVARKKTAPRKPASKQVAAKNVAKPAAVKSAARPAPAPVASKPIAKIVAKPAAKPRPAPRAPAAPPQPNRDDTQAAYAALRNMLMRHAARLRLVSDRPGEITFEAGFAPEWNKILFFGAAAVRKSYVSYYLFPVYVFPELLDGLSPQLKARLDGTRSCFNFVRHDPKLFEELGALTEKGFERFGRAGWLR
jgi:hypothetical protein